MARLDRRCPSMSERRRFILSIWGICPSSCHNIVQNIKLNMKMHYQIRSKQKRMNFISFIAYIYIDIGHSMVVKDNVSWKSRKVMKRPAELFVLALLTATPFPGGFKCFTCEEAADNYECNRWAPDVYCPQGKAIHLQLFFLNFADSFGITSAWMISSPKTFLVRHITLAGFYPAH